MSRLKWIPIVSGSMMIFFFGTMFLGSTVISGVGYVLDFLPDNPNIHEGKPINYNLPETAILCARVGETNPSNCVISGSITTVTVP